ncbi:uncharacterized protein [Palaemon carinicauda]|uniref:uncharacterized protein n=1 Tax=Palaemon carinicauda TaxID=392227 RepID=UPI0035B5741B
MWDDSEERQDEVEQETEEAQPPSTEEDEEDTDGGARSRQITLPKRVERDLGKWLQKHPYLYDRGVTDYKNSEKKKRTITEKGRSMKPPLTYEQLARWLHTKRTRYGRILAKVEKNGVAKTRLTDLEKWIYELFSFMEKHIVRKRATRALGLSQSAATAAPPPTLPPREPGPPGVHRVPHGEDTSADEEKDDILRELGAMEAEHVGRAPKRRRVASSTTNITERKSFDGLVDLHTNASNTFIQQVRGIHDAETAFWKGSVTDGLAHLLRPVPKNKAHIISLELVTLTARLVSQHSTPSPCSIPTHAAPAPAPVAPVLATAQAMAPPTATLLHEATSSGIGSFTSDQWALLQRLLQQQQNNLS